MKRQSTNDSTIAGEVVVNYDGTKVGIGSVALDATNDKVTVYSGASSDVVGLETVFNTTLTNAASSIKGSPGKLYGCELSSTAMAANVFVQVFDLTSGSIVLGTTVPKMSFMIPVLDKEKTIIFPVPVSMAVALSVAATSTATGNGAPSSTVNANWFYK